MRSARQSRIPFLSATSDRPRRSPPSDDRLTFLRMLSLPPAGSIQSGLRLFHLSDRSHPDRQAGKGLSVHNRSGEGAGVHNRREAGKGLGVHNRSGENSGVHRCSSGPECRQRPGCLHSIRRRCGCPQSSASRQRPGCLHSIRRRCGCPQSSWVSNSQHCVCPRHCAAVVALNSFCDPGPADWIWTAFGVGVILFLRDLPGSVFLFGFRFTGCGGHAFEAPAGGICPPAAVLPCIVALSWCKLLPQKPLG